MKRMTTGFGSQNWVVLKFLTLYTGSACVFLAPFPGLSLWNSNQHTLKRDFYEKNRRELLKLWCAEVRLTLICQPICTLDFTVLIWLNSLFSETLDIGEHIFISIMSKTGFHWELLSLRSKILTQTLHEKWSFPWKISSVNVTKSAVSWGLVTFTEEILNGKLHFLCSEK